MTTNTNTYPVSRPDETVSVFRRFVSFIKSEPILTVESLAMVRQEDPEGISSSERLSIRSSEFSGTDVFSYESRCNSPGEAVFLSSMLTCLIIAASCALATMCFSSHTSLKEKTELESVLFFMPCVIFFMISVSVFFRTKYKSYKRVCMAVRMMKDADWMQIFIKTAADAEAKACTLCPELKTFQNFLNRSLQYGYPFQKTDASDIVGMLRLSDEIRDTVARYVPYGADIIISGEHSELLNRMTENLAGRSLRDVTEALEKREKITLGAGE